jgi:hypothetical protein
MGEGKRRGLFGFWEIGLLWRKRRLTDFLVGVGKPQHIFMSGSSALEAS